MGKCRGEKSNYGIRTEAAEKLREVEKGQKVRDGHNGAPTTMVDPTSNTTIYEDLNTGAKK